MTQIVRQHGRPSLTPLYIACLHEWYAFVHKLYNYGVMSVRLFIYFVSEEDGVFECSLGLGFSTENGHRKIFQILVNNGLI